MDADGRLKSAKEAGRTLLSATSTADGEWISKTDVTGSHACSFGLFDSHLTTGHTPGLSQRKNGVDRFLHHDWLGSTRYLTDLPPAPDQPSVKHAARYDAYGNRMLLGGALGAPDGVPVCRGVGVSAGGGGTAIPG